MLSIPHCGENMFFLWSEMLLSQKEKDCQGGNVKATAICGGRTTWLGDKNCPLCAYVFKSLRQHNIICSRGAFRGPSIHPTQSQKLIAVEYLSLLPVYNRLWAFKPVYTEAFKPVSCILWHHNWQDCKLVIWGFFKYWLSTWLVKNGSLYTVAVQLPKSSRAIQWGAIFSAVFGWKLILISSPEAYEHRELIRNNFHPKTAEKMVPHCMAQLDLVNCTLSKSKSMMGVVPSSGLVGT